MAEVNARKRGSKWQYYFEGAKLDGKRQRVCKSGFDTKKDALAAGIKALVEYNNCGRTVADSDISVKDFADIYLKECQDVLKWSTYVSYKAVLEAHLVKKLGVYKLSNITTDVAQDFLVEMKTEGLASSTIRKNKNVSNMMFECAIRHKLINDNPFKEAKTPKTIERRGNPNFYYSDSMINEFKKIYKGDILEVVLMLGYHCGLRLSESLAITWDDIDFENKKLTISRQVIRRDGVSWFTSPKYDSVREIDLDDTFIEYAKNLKERKMRYPSAKSYVMNLDKSIELYDSQTDAGHDTHPFFFVVSKIDSEILTQKFVHNLLDRYKHEGLKVFRPHCLRHTHCTKLLMNGSDVKYVQYRMGHKSVKTTLDIYTHLTEEKSTSEVARLNNLF